MKVAAAALLLAVLLAGCATAERVSDSVEENPLIYQMAMRQVLYRTIGTDPEKVAAAFRLVKALREDGGRVAALDELGDEIRDRIGYDELEPVDAALVDDLLALARQRVEPYIDERGVLTDEGRKALVNLLAAVEDDLANLAARQPLQRDSGQP